MDNCHARDQRTADIAGHGKTILTGRMSKKKKYFRLEKIILRRKVERYAAAFQKLADTFYGMPYKRNT